MYRHILFDFSGPALYPAGRMDGSSSHAPAGGLAMRLDPQLHAIVGDHGSLPVGQEDEVAWKLAMLIEGECEGLGPSKAAEKFGFSKQRYFQLRQVYQQHGAQALASRLRGPKRNYRRTDEVVRQVIRHRFLDADASAEVIAQKLHQTGLAISTRSVERVIADYGLEKKALLMSSQHRATRRP
jgi:transposase